MNFIIKSIRYIIFVLSATISICLMFAVFLLIVPLLTAIALWINQKLGFIITGIIMAVGGFGLLYSIYFIFKVMCAYVIELVKKISPSLKFAFYTFFTLIAINTIYDIYSIWTDFYKEYTLLFVCVSIVFTIIALGFSYTVLEVAGNIPDGYDEKK